MHAKLNRYMGQLHKQILRRVKKNMPELKARLNELDRNVCADAAKRFHYLLTTESGKLTVESADVDNQEWPGRFTLVCKEGLGQEAITTAEYDAKWANNTTMLELNIWGLDAASER